jgi:RHS repeat-associated protein
MSEIDMDKSAETLASLIYTRDNDGQVKKTVSKGLPGGETTEDAYDENNRLTKAGSTEYKYDAANNPTTEGSSTNTFNEGDELEKGTGVSYTYNELGERTKRTPTSGPAITYAYDQAGNLTSVERPKEGETSEIKDTYAYNGEGLRTSQTISGTTSYLAWDMAEELPLILRDGTNSYIYGPGGLPVEQISSGGTVTYIHHDQQGSTRLLTGSTGKNEGAYTYTAYGAIQEHTGTATTPLGYDAQYTSSDTGLIYLRARVYDPATAQFLTVDPINPITRAPYTYVNDNPLNRVDRTGLCSIDPESSENCFSEAPGAIGGVVESVAQNPVEAGGIALGVVSVGAGAGAVAGVSGAEAVGGSAGLGAISAVTGAGGAALDGTACLNGDSVACAGLGLNGAGSALGLGATLIDAGVIEGSDALKEGLGYSGLGTAILGLGADIYGLICGLH